MSPTLVSMINGIISAEIGMSMKMINEMNNCHVEGLQGLKRMNRYYAEKRYRYAVCLSNFMAEFFHTAPIMSVSYSTSNTPATTLISSIKEIYTSSTAHLKLLKDAAKQAIVEEEDLLMGKLEHMIKMQSMDNERYHRLSLEVARDKSNLYDIDMHTHTKYKAKEVDDFNFKDPDFR